MNLQPQISRLRNSLVADASKLGKSLAEHAATELAQAHINWQRVCAISIAVAFTFGAFMGYSLHG